MISRRRFLQALLSLPAIAALPAVGTVLEALPEQDYEPATPARPMGSGLRVWLNNVLLSPQSMTMHTECDHILVGSIGYPRWMNGLETTTMSLEVIHDPCLRSVLALDHVTLRADLKSAVLFANARVRSSSIQMYGPNTVITENIELMLLDARWEGA